MHPPLFIRPLSETERAQLRAGLHSAHAFTLRRCQILLASDQGQDATLIARNLGCSKGTALNALRAFRAEGLPALEDLLHHSPRLSGKPTSLWTLDLVAEVCCARGWTPRVLTGEAIRQALRRLGISWRRAKHWITSPDPAYARKKTRATG